jgi:ketosteroid isomerase-like protein
LDDAVNAGDLVRLLTLMADDVVFLNPGQAPFGRDGFPVGFSAAHQQSRIRCISELEEVVIDGEVAYTLCRDSKGIRQSQLYGVRPMWTFREAAQKYLKENEHKKSVSDDERLLAMLDPVRQSKDGLTVPVKKMNNTGWRSARERAADAWERAHGTLAPEGFRRVRVHDLKHTFGRRLRAAGVSFEDRQDLLGHKSQRITTHYSNPEGFQSNVDGDSTGSWTGFRPDRGQFPESAG